MKFKDFELAIDFVPYMEFLTKDSLLNQLYDLIVGFIKKYHNNKKKNSLF